MPARAGEREHGPGPGHGKQVQWLVTPKAPIPDKGRLVEGVRVLDGVGETAFEAAQSVGLALHECFHLAPLPPDASKPFVMPADPFRQLRSAPQDVCSPETCPGAIVDGVCLECGRAEPE